MYEYINSAADGPRHFSLFLYIYMCHSQNNHVMSSPSYHKPESYVISLLHNCTHFTNDNAFTLFKNPRKLVSHFWSALFSSKHGLTNYIDTTTKCRHLKKLTVRGLFDRGVFIRVIDWRYFRHVGIFEPDL